MTNKWRTASGRQKCTFPSKKLEGSIPVTWVTVHSEHIGNTFGPKGFSIGSSRHVSSSK